MNKIAVISVMFLVVVINGCSSAQKARKEERDKVALSKGVFCDFVSESDFKDVDVELNLRLAKRCNTAKPFSISGYKRVSENPGVLFCCNSESSNESDNGGNKTSNASGNVSGKQGE